MGFLRFIGVLNAAVWLGGAVFFTVAARPALFSEEMAALIQARNFPYFSRAIEQIVGASYSHFLIACAVVALLHLLAEWLYLGRPSRKLSLSLLVSLFVVALIGSAWLQPNLRRLHAIAYSAGVTDETRAVAARSFRNWNAIATVLNLGMIGGLVVYLWRTTHPADTPRFISSVKFRG